MADDIRRLKHTAEELDKAVDMLLETFTRDEINTKFSEIKTKITKIETRLTALENPSAE